MIDQANMEMLNNLLTMVRWAGYLVLTIVALSVIFLAGVLDMDVRLALWQRHQVAIYKQARKTQAEA